jgi:hypothetical protein
MAPTNSGFGVIICISLILFLFPFSQRVEISVCRFIHVCNNFCIRYCFQVDVLTRMVFFVSSSSFEVGGCDRQETMGWIYILFRLYRKASCFIYFSLPLAMYKTFGLESNSINLSVHDYRLRVGVSSSGSHDHMLHESNTKVWITIRVHTSLDTYPGSCAH